MGRFTLDVGTTVSRGESQLNAERELTISTDTLIHCSLLAFDGGCKMASSLKLFNAVVNRNLEL